MSFIGSKFGICSDELLGMICEPPAWACREASVFGPIDFKGTIRGGGSGSAPGTITNPIGGLGGMTWDTVRRLVSLSVVLAVAGIAGCKSLEPLPKDTPEGLLGGSSWQLQQLGAQGAIAGSRPTLVFVPAGKVSGTGSCNQFSGTVKIDGKSITFGPLATTRMVCAGALNAQEATYLKALQEAQWFTVAGNTLTIYTKAMEQPLVYFRSKAA
jgi:heat shock protein HslJ